MFVTMVIAALLVNGLFSLLGAIPSGPRPTRADIFGSLQVNYKLFLNVLGLAIFAALFWITTRRGATDPMCGMKVDRAKAVKKEVAGATLYFCSEHCLHAYESGQSRDLGKAATPTRAAAISSGTRPRAATTCGRPAHARRPRRPRPAHAR